VYSVLYVDDEPALLDVGRLFLEKDGQFSVDTIASAPDALALMETKTYDAIIADYQMPVMDGIGFLKKVRGMGNTIPFILFTGKGREEIVIQALNEGADFYLQKGGDPVAQFAELAHKVRLAVQQRRAEASIRDHERREADIINFLPDPTFAIDTKGTVIAWNRAMEGITGVSMADILGKSDYAYALPFYHDRRPLLIDLVLNPDETFEKEKYLYTIHDATMLTAETIITRPQGNPVRLWGKACRLFDKSGNLAGAIESIRDITDRNLVEERLRESEERYRRIVETTGEGISQLDEDLKIVYVNRRMAEMHGYSPEEMIGKNIALFMVPEDIPVITSRIKEHRSGKSGRYKRRFVTRDGSIRWLQVSSTPLSDPDGTFKGSFAMYSDITDHKAAEEKLRQNYDELATNQALLRESEQRYRNVIEDQTEFISRFLPDGTHVFVNEAYCRYFGLKRGELLGHRFRPEIPFQDQKCLHAFFASLTPDHPVGTIEHRIVMPDGSIQWQRWSDRAIFDPSGTITEYQSVGRDITERKLAEEAVHYKTALLEAQVNSSPDGILIVDRGGKKILQNQRCVDLWKLPQGIVENEDDETQIRHAMQMTRNPERFVKKIAYLYDHPDETSRDEVELTDGRVFDRHSAPVLDREGHNYGRIWTFREITANKEAEAALRDVNKKLSLLSKITRHDINNQLTLLRGYLQVLDTGQADPLFRAHFQKALAAAHTISSLIQFTREYEEIGVHAPVWQNCHALAGAAANDALRGMIRLQNDLPPATEVFADPLIARVFYNLVDNAIRHGRKSTAIRFFAQESGDGLLIVCQDDGDGIPAGEKERIFERDFGRNTGLGLFLSREVLGITGITIRENGEPGTGARFEMAVPKNAYRTSVTR